MSIFDEIDNYVDGLGEFPDFKGASSDEYYGTEKSERSGVDSSRFGLQTLSESDSNK